MSSYTLNILGLEISFKTDAESRRIEAAQALIRDRAEELTRNARDMSKEKVLTFLTLSLADDYLVAEEKRARLEEKISEILEKTSDDSSR